MSEHVEVLSIKVDRPLWYYLQKSARYAGKLAELRKNVTVELAETSDNGILLSGGDLAQVKQGTHDVEQLLDSCKRDTKIERLDCSERPEVLAKLEQSQEDWNSGAFVYVEGGYVCVLGTEEEVSATVKQLVDDYDLEGESEIVVLETSGSDSHKNMVKVGSEIWKYMQKSGKYGDEVRRIRNEMHVEIVESTVPESDAESATMTTLVFNGVENDVEAAVTAARTAIEDCLKNVSTIRVPCSDDRVFSKLLKVFKTLNKVQGLISAADKVIWVTGTTSEISECRDKLQKLGVVFQSPEPDVEKQKTKPKVNAEVMKLESQREVAAVTTPPTQPTGPDDSWRNITGSDDFGGDFSVSGFGETVDQLALERPLWKYIEKQYREKLNQLSEVFGLRIIPESGQGNIFMIRLEADTADMLFLGRESLQEIVNTCLKSVTVVEFRLNTKGPLSPELRSKIEGIAASSNAVADIVDDRLSFIGTEESTSMCRQQIGALMHQILSTTTQQGMSMEGGQGMRQPYEQDGRFGATMGMRGPSDGFPGQVGSFGGAGGLFGQMGGADGLFGGQSGGPGQLGLMGSQSEGSVGMFGRSGGTDGLFGGHSGGFGQFESTGGQSRGPDIRRAPNDDDDDDTFLRVVTGRTSAQEASAAVARSSDQTVVNAASSGRPKEVTNVQHTTSGGRKDADNCSAEGCTICKDEPNRNSAAKKCPHAFCMSCIQMYFANGEKDCPVCGVKCDLSGHKITQPMNGRMIVTHDKTLKLTGHESASDGTIVVTYCFPSGLQSDDMPNPGRRYRSLTKTAFFPDNKEGNQIIHLLRKVFEARMLFFAKPSNEGVDDELDVRGVRHKTSLFGGPQHNGYPDPVYTKRVLNDLSAFGLD